MNSRVVFWKMAHESYQNLKGSFPDSCKVAKLKPLCKNRFQNQPFKLQAKVVALLISKIMEKIIHEQTSSFHPWIIFYTTINQDFEKKKTLDRFMPYVFAWYNLKGFDKDIMTGMILIDLQKAFGTIDHHILLVKLKVIDFSNHTIDKFKSYLSNSIAYSKFRKPIQILQILLVGYHKGPFWDHYCFSYTWMTPHSVK